MKRFGLLLCAAAAQGAAPEAPLLDHAPYARVQDYFQKLTRTSDRIRLLDIGRSGYDRPMFVAAIGNLENIRKLSALKGKHEGIAFAWAGFGPAEVQKAAEFAYALVSAKTVRRDVVLFLAPCLNPDGVDFLAEWHRQNFNSEYANAPLPRLVQRYAGSDAAADEYMMNLVETRNLASVRYREYVADFVYSGGDPMGWLQGIGQAPPKQPLVQYVVAQDQWDLPSAFDLLQRFSWNGADIMRRKSDGSLVARGGQRITEMVEKLRLPELMNVHVEKLDGAFDGEPVSDLRPAGGSGGSGEAVLLDPHENNSYLGVAFLFDRMELVWWTADGQLRIDSGFTNSPVRALNFSHEIGIKSHLADPATAPPKWQLYRPRVAVYEPWMDNPDTGWTEWVLDVHKVPFTVVHNEDFAKDDLYERFDVILLASQPAGQMMHGDRSVKQRPEYAGGIGLDGTAHLEHFARRGGTLIAMGQATALAVEQFGLPVKQVGVAAGIARVSTAADDPINFGMPKDFVAEDPEGMAWAADAGTVTKFATGEAAVEKVKWGQGKVLLFGIRPQYRGQTFGTFKLLLNAITTGRAREIR